MHPRHTIERTVEIEGIGLHSGRAVRIRLVPAPAEHGVVFIRTDGATRVPIPATLEHVGPSFYQTVLRAGEHEVSTVEHLMAALYALRIDDVAVEIDGPELPILDGSSKPFVEALERAGARPLERERLYLTVTRPIVVAAPDDDEKRIAVYPSREFRVSYAIDFDHPMLGYQELSVGLWEPGAFAAKLAPARTFTFEKDVEALQERGLALGGSLDNAVVVGESGILNDELRFDDEFVRHKMLDLAGDLALLGRPIRAHVVAYRAGHDLHGRLARRIRDAHGCWYLAPWADADPHSRATAGA